MPRTKKKTTKKTPDKKNIKKILKRLIKEEDLKQKNKFKLNTQNF